MRAASADGTDPHYFNGFPSSAQAAAATPWPAQILDGITDGFIALHKDHRCAHLNQAAAAFLKTTPDKVQGQILWDALPGLRDSRFYEEFARAAQENAFVRVEDFHEPLGRWCEWRCHPTPEGFAILIHDATDHKKVEQTMLESRQVLELAVEGSNAGIWRTDLNPEKPGYMPDYLYLSPHLKALIGFESNELPNSRAAWFERIMPEDLPRVKEAARDHAEGRTDTYQVDFRIRHKDGSLRWLSSRGRLYRDEFDRPLRWAGVDTDITEQKRIAEALHESEDRLHQALEAGEVFTFEWRPATDLVLRSPNCAAILGWTGDATRDTGQRYFERVHPVDREAFVRLVSTLTPERPAYETTYRYVRLDDEREVVLEESGRAVFDESGTMVRLQGLTRDITEGKRIAEALRQANERLQLQTEELQSSNEELKTQQEELQSQAEELQNANEELQAQREELQVQTEELRRSERALREAHEQAAWLGRFPAENPNPVLRVAFSGEVLYGNPASAWLPGWACEVGEPLPQAALRHLVGKALAEGRALEQDVELDGTYYAVAVAPVPAECYANVYGRDITERKQAEDALRMSEERLRLAQQAARIGAFDWDIATGRNTWTPELEAMYGLEAGQFGKTQTSWEQLVHPDDRESAIALVDRTFQTGAPVEGQWRVQWPDGGIHWIFGRFQAIKNAAGEVVHLTGVNIDVTERKQAEEKATKEHRETAFANRVLRAFVEYEGDELFDRALAVVQDEMASRHGVFGYIAEPGHLICPSLSKMLDECEIEGKCIHYPPEKWKGLWARALTEKRSLYTNEAPPVPPGHPIIHNNLAAPILFQGEAIGLLNVANKEGGYSEQDRETLDAIAARVAPVLYAWIQRKLREDERTRAEEALRQLNEKLEQRVEERTADLSKANEALKVERQRLYDVLETLPAYVVLLSKDYHVPFANRFFRERFGESHGKRCFEYLFNRTEPCEVCDTYKVLKTNAPQRWEWTGPDGRIYDIYDFPFTDTDGAPLIMEMGIDITERKRAEAALKEANETLEQRVVERTTALQEASERLQAQSKELQAINEELNAQTEELTAQEEELRTANEELRASEQAMRKALAQAEAGDRMLATLMANVPEGITICDASGNLRMVSRHGQDLLGGPHADKSIEEVVQDWTVYRPDGQTVLPTEELPLIRALKGEEVRDVELMQVNADGRKLPLLCNAAPIRDADGQVVAAVVAWHDITARKLAEEALRASEDKYRNLFENMAEEVHFWQIVRDEAGEIKTWRLVDANPPTLKTWGRASVDEIRGKTTDEIFGPGATEHFMPVVRKIMTEGVPYSFEDYFANLDRHFRFTSVPLGEYFITTGADITSIKKAQQALAASERKYRELIETANSVIIRWDNQGVIRFINDYGLRFFGYSAEELLDHDVMTIVPKVEESTGRDLDALVKDIVVHPEQYTYAPSENITKDGTTVWVAWTNKAILDEQGNVCEILAIGNDITELKQAEAAVRRNQQTFTELIERSPFGTYVVDSQFRVAMMNASSQEGAFRNVRPVIGRDFGEAMRTLWPDPVAAEIIGHFRHTLETGVPYYSPRFINPRHDVETVESYEWELHRMTLPDGQYGVVCYYFDSTRLREAEEALRQSEQRFRLALRNAPVSVAAQDRDLRYVWAYNQKTASPDEIIGHFDHEIFTPEEAEHFTTLKRRVLDEGVELQEQRWLDRPNGRVFLNLCWEPVRDETGQIVGVASSTVDLTPLKLTEEALRESEERLRRVARAGRIGLFEWNATRDTAYWSPEHYELFGFEPDSLIKYERWLACVHPDDRERITRNMASLMADGGTEASADPHRDEYRIVRGDGTVLWLETTVSAERVGADVIMRGAVRDITDRKRAERALQRSHERFKLLSETAANLLAAENPLKVVHDLCRKVMKHLDCQVFFNFVADEKVGRLHLNACAGVSKKQFRQIEWLDYGQAVCGCVARDGQRLVAQDIPAHPDVRTDLVVSYGITAYACHPLLAGDEVIGTLSFGTTTRTQFNDEDLSLMKTVADQVAVAMERIRSQETLRESEQRFRRAVENATGAIVIAGYDGAIHYANPAFLTLVGYSEQDREAGRLRWDAITPPEYAHLDAEAIAELQRHGVAGPREKEYFTKDGGRVSVLMSGAVMGDGPDGQPQVVAFITDVTPIKKAERAIRESEQRLRLALEGGRMGLWERDIEADRSFWDERVYELLGLDPKGRAGHERLIQHVDPRDVESLNQRIEKSLADGSDFQAEFRLKRHGGEPIWVASRGKTIRDTSGKAVRMLGVLFDITQRKQMEDDLRRLNEHLEEEVQVQTEELQDSIERLQDEVARRVLAEGQLRKQGQMLEGFFRHTITPLAFMDRHFTFVQVNEAYARADGQTPEFFRGKNHFELYPNDENRALFEEVVRTGEPYRVFAKPFAYPDNPQRTSYWDWQLTPLRNEQGQVQYLVLNLQDVTQKQMAVDELEHRAFQLQKLTLELSLAEERERRRMAEVLHDGLQQQLAAAKFHLGLLSSRAKSDATMQEIAVQLDSMLRDAIEQSRNLSHELSPAVLYQSDLGETFEWLARQVKTKHGLTVHTEVHGLVDSQSESIKAFLYRTGQEILFNTVKHAKVQEVRLRLQRKRDRLWLTIADQGDGFDPDMLAQSTGFGLLSIRERVGLLGGRMRIRSAPGKGSTFLIAVPDAQTIEERGQRTEDRGQKTERTGQHRPASSGGHPAILRVLLVDDHKVMREGLAALIGEQDDMEIVGQAGDGGEAVERARQLQPDVIIMDVAMPVIPGDEATRRIKAERPEVRIIALSMFTEPGVREKMLDAGAEDYLPKTGPSEGLLAAIRGEEP